MALQIIRQPALSTISAFPTLSLTTTRPVTTTARASPPITAARITNSISTQRMDRACRRDVPLSRGRWQFDAPSPDSARRAIDSRRHDRRDQANRAERNRQPSGYPKGDGPVRRDLRQRGGLKRLGMGAATALRQALRTLPAAIPIRSAKRGAELGATNRELAGHRSGKAIRLNSHAPQRLQL